MQLAKPAHVALVTLILAPAYAVADGRDLAVELATPPVWFFRGFDSFSGAATCTAVNLHDKPITLKTRLILHDDDSLPYPIIPDTLSGGEVEQVLKPGEATALSDGRSSDALLARCVFEYEGDPMRVKAAIILEDGRALTASAELVKAEKIRRHKRDEN